MGNVQSAPPAHLYTIGGPGGWGGRQRGRAGYGGSGVQSSGGPAGEVAGWTETPFMWGAGGCSCTGAPSPEPDNSGNGGDGSQWSTYGKGGSGRFYVRLRI